MNNSSLPTCAQLTQSNDFVQRHIGPNDAEIKDMLNLLGFSSLDEMINKVVPSKLRYAKGLAIGEALSEHDTLAKIKKIAQKNKLYKSYIGMGFYDCLTPTVIQRNILEDPGWYTSYTPYQAEISQGRLEALLNFQTLCQELSGMEIANSSLLDEGTAAAEAMIMCFGLRKNKNLNFFIAKDCHPHVIEVVQTRARPLGINVVIVDDVHDLDSLTNGFGLLLSYPTTYGKIGDYADVIEGAHSRGWLVTIDADLLSLTLLKPPGEFGADIVVGSTQRFGVPLGFGGPSAAYFATRDKFKRNMPGRLVGISKDAKGRPALRLALQTREQHIRREKATSNICTAQVLLANMVSMYAVYHGPEGLKKIGQRIHRLTLVLAEGLRELGFTVEPDIYFDTIVVALSKEQCQKTIKMADAHRINFRLIDERRLGIALDETTSKEDLNKLFAIFSDGKKIMDIEVLDKKVQPVIPEKLLRKSSFLNHPVFNTYHSETELLRYIQRLQEKDLSLAHAMIPLGSCTMKLNGTTEMIPISWNEFSSIHPFVPLDQAQGYLEMMDEFKKWLRDITGFAGISFQPNAGSQGEYTGLSIIRAYHESKGESHRHICLIPVSAHGTNPASAVMAGFQVVGVACNSLGNIDVADLKAKAEANKDLLAALMITYPSTHGVFEESVDEICRIIHECGGQVYLDGANMNALVGLCRVSDLGADVCHINLHKTFAIPHGGGGPGVGPVGVARHLVQFLPKHSVISEAGPSTGISAVASGPYGSASVLPISWSYISMMGSEGLKKASEVAILNANYIAKRLEKHFNVLYKGEEGMVAHECILDVRPLKQSADISVDDVAKRLIDYGFHAPTMSWPVPGTLMVEPTESESKAELDRFCDAMIAIHGEAKAIENGTMNAEINPLKCSPHTVADLVDNWDRPYSREQAVFPLPSLKRGKYWSPVNRVDNVHGDRYPMCNCGNVEL